MFASTFYALIISSYAAIKSLYLLIPMLKRPHKIICRIFKKKYKLANKLKLHNFYNWRHDKKSNLKIGTPTIDYVVQVINKA